MSTNHFNLKTTLTVILLLLLALWSGYGLGYRHGRQDELVGWLSRLQNQNGKVVLGPRKWDLHPTHAVNSSPEICRK